jgi:hypothetical protein
MSASAGFIMNQNGYGSYHAWVLLLFCLLYYSDGVAFILYGVGHGSIISKCLISHRFFCRWFLRHFQQVFGGRPTVLVTNVGTGTEMEGAIICGLDVVGFDMSSIMYSCAATRLANVMQAQAYRLKLSKHIAQKPEDYLPAAQVTLPGVVLASPDKRQRALLQKNTMGGLHILYHTMLGLPWPTKLFKGRTVPAAGFIGRNIIETGLKIYIM